MVCGLMEVSLKLYGIKSLKDKRSVVKPLIAKLRSDFNCSVIESDAQDSHEIAVLSIATLNTSGPELDTTLEIMLKAIFHKSNLEPVVTRREVFS